MAIIKFNSTKFEQKKIVFCMIDDHSLYPNNWVQEIVKNNADFEIGKITGMGFDVLIGYDADYILRQACQEYDYAIVSSMGSVTSDNLNFYSLVERFCKENDFYILGHILDKKEAYYELHPQCFIINLEYHRRLKCPIIGERELGKTHYQMSPIRSADNFHDEYTPKWIKPGNEETVYYHKCHGWNIISEALRNSLNVYVFNDEFRNSKKYLYPDNNSDIISRLSEFYLEQNVASRNWVNPFSTGSIYFGPKLNGNLKYLVSPAMGLDFVHYLNYYGFDSNTTVRFTDYNLLSLEFMQELVNWDGNDYINFLNGFSIRKSKFLNLPENIWLGTKEGLEKKWSEIEKRYSWKEFWNTIKEKVKFEFRYKDFLHYEGPNGKDQGYWIDPELDDPCTLINLNHVFNYHSTSVFYSLKYRVEMENYTLKKLKEIVPRAHIMFDQRAWSGYRAYNTNSLCSSVSEIELVDMSDLIRPTWHYNRDWS